ncbi:ABC transporter permease [Micromonospora antibiotica]|uniref:Transport permease protein n=1 Tax=Micromonospora antibiotica TaxID=2807623 RepID=A0ABS3V784_9ACTN|nr:ABC transporter permease [Micromonospora antibiotica]MBO4161483.1 ABC transporter permease [Micromonospora antibiotica]
MTRSSVPTVPAQNQPTTTAAHVPDGPQGVGLGPLQLRSFLALLLRDLTVLRRNVPEFALRTLLQPVLFSFVFAYLFPRIGQGLSSQANFADVLVPGLVAVTAVFCGVSTVSLPLAIEFGATREIEDRIMAPVPGWAIATEKIVFGAVQSLAAGLLVLPACVLTSATPVNVEVRDPALLVVVALLACWISGALGLVVGTVVEPKRMGLAFSTLIVPLTFFGCVYYPWQALTPLPWLKVAVLANPVVYLSEGLRAALTPSVPHMSTAAYLGAGTAFATAMTVLGLRLFQRRVRL